MAGMKPEDLHSNVSELNIQTFEVSLFTIQARF